jgi:hypothetical protein
MKVILILLILFLLTRTEYFKSPSKQMNGFCEENKYCGLTHFWSSNPFGFNKERQLYDVRSN